MFNLVSKVQAVSLGQIGGDTNLLLKEDAPIYNASQGSFNWQNLFNFVAQTLFFISAIACFVYLIWGGINMITSSGETAKKEKARNQIVFALIGLLIVGAAFAIWRLILHIVGVDNSLSVGF